MEDKIAKLKDGRSIKIRTARQADADAYLQLGRVITAEQIYSLTQPEELNMTVAQEAEWIEAAFKNDCHLILCADFEGQIVGQLDFSNGRRKRNAHTGDFGMGVHPDYRGLGIGDLLLETLITWAKRHSVIEKINLSVHQTNLRAMELYKKHGFAVEGVRTKDLKYPDGVYVDTVIMGLSVS